jgi:hypothetical protein|nr:MAG TPA: hypothetical protein [Caudoviricetes sp.]DAW05533.1 MAG TPA: hypothetical protein [Caudoviricetes sp.]
MENNNKDLKDEKSLNRRQERFSIPSNPKTNTDVIKDLANKLKEDTNKK